MLNNHDQSIKVHFFYGMRKTCNDLSCFFCLDSFIRKRDLRKNKLRFLCKSKKVAEFHHVRVPLDEYRKLLFKKNNDRTDTWILNSELDLVIVFYSSDPLYPISSKFARGSITKGSQNEGDWTTAFSHKLSEQGSARTSFRRSQASIESEVKTK